VRVLAWPTIGFGLPSKNPRATFCVMSSVGFSSQADSEIEQLRKAYRTLNDLLKTLTNAEVCLKNLDLKLTGDHLKVAKWSVGQAQKAIAAVGQAKSGSKA
jgi:hypothetical protein